MFYLYTNILNADAYVTGLSRINKPGVLRYNFYCTGDEAHLTDCVVASISNICGNRRVKLMCETAAAQVISNSIHWQVKCVCTCTCKVKILHVSNIVDNMMLFDKPQPVVQL